MRLWLGQGRSKYPAAGIKESLLKSLSQKMRKAFVHSFLCYSCFFKDVALCETTMQYVVERGKKPCYIRHKRTETQEKRGNVKMKVLLLNGSSNQRGCTYTALEEAADVLKNAGVACKILQLGSDPVRDCTGCGKCVGRDGKCVFEDDIVNEIIEEAKESDGFIFGTPVYYAHPSGRILSVLDRVFYAGAEYFAHKPAASIASARRAGTTASLDVLNKYFTISEMPVVASTYWNMVHGVRAEDVKKDMEGLQTIRNLAANMAWLLKCIEAGKEQGIRAPRSEHGAVTNFIRTTE